MFCSNCGSQLADGAKFCSECGARVSRPEPEFRTFPDIDFSEPEATKTFEKAPEPEEKPVREKVSFDWSNVVDEPHKREIPDIKSPWGTTGNIDEKELFAEMSNPGGKSRTMSFIDVLKAEKEERERAAADRAIEYTEVLHFDQDLGPFDEVAGIKFAPLYDDVDEPVKTPFDAPEFKEPEPVIEDEPKFEEEPAPMEANGLTEPDEAELKLSRETIAQFDEFVKSFEREAGIAEEPEPEAPEFEEPPVSAPKFELPDFLKKIADFGKEEEPEIEEPEEPEVEEPFQTDEPPVIELEEVEEEPEYEEPVAEAPVFEEPVAEEPVFEEPKYDESESEDAAEDEASMEDLYLDLDESETTGKFGTRFELNKYDYDEEEEDDEEEEEEEEESPVDEDELFKEMEESVPEKPSMTIAPPADKESEIEALRKRLAELTGVDMYAPEDLGEAADLEDLEDEPEAEPEDILFDEPGDDIFAEPEEEEEETEPAGETFAFEVELTPEVDELFANLEPASKAAIAEVAFSPEITPELDALFDSLKPASVASADTEAVIPAEPAVEAEPEAEPEPAVEDLYLKDEPEEKPEMPKAPTIRLDGAGPVTEPPAPEFDVEIPEEIFNEEVPELYVEVEEPVVPAVEESAPEPVVEEAVEEPAVEEPAEVKDTDALSLEELERDLFGDALDEEVEAEETKKIDKFYTLYRKNEEFQRLLDEEYEKLKHGGGLTEEEKQAVDAVPKMADVEAATKAAAAAPAPAPAPAEPEKPEVPVEKEKAYRQVEDETIYMPKELLDEQMKVDFTQASAVAEPKAPAEVPEDKPKKKEDKKKVEVEYEDVEHGSKFLTILAVIIAIILIALLAVILILQIAPDSGAAAWIDSLIESITSNFSMLPPGGGQFLL